MEEIIKLHVTDYEVGVNEGEFRCSAQKKGEERTLSTLISRASYFLMELSSLIP